MKNILIILTTGAVFLITAEASAHGSEDFGMGPGMMWGHGMGGTMAIFMILFWLAVIVGIVFVIRWLLYKTEREKKIVTADSALDILKKRYAQGEINKEEFAEKKKILGE